MALIKRLQRTVTAAPLGPWATLAWMVIAVALPTVARMALNPLLGTSLWFATYYPATLVATLYLGAGPGILVVVMSTLAANIFFMPPQMHLTATIQSVASSIVFILSAGLIVFTTSLLRTTLSRLSASIDREQILNNELNHRLKNTMAIIDSLIHQTAKRPDYSAADFTRLLSGRLHALNTAHGLLATGEWETCELPDLAARALSPFREHGAIDFEGPACTLRAECCVPLVLALHELATNAAKYGALSVQHGRVELSWRILPHPTGDRVVIRWAEMNGPSVSAPKRRGLGTRLLVRQTGLEAVDLRFNPQGVTCDITVQAAPAAQRAPGRKGAAAEGPGHAVTANGP
jgi:two-component sensor histidine kinase